MTETTTTIGIWIVQLNYQPEIGTSYDGGQVIMWEQNPDLTYKVWITK